VGGGGRMTYRIACGFTGIFQLGAEGNNLESGRTGGFCGFASVSRGLNFTFQADWGRRSS